MEVERRDKDYKSAVHVEAYEYFTGGEERHKRLEDFIECRTTHLILDYPLLEDDNEINRIYNHNSLATWNGENSSTVSNEVELAQAALVMQSAAARRLLGNADEKQLRLAEDRLRVINAELFGSPDKQLVLSCKKIIQTRLKNKNFSGRAVELLAELNNGFDFIGSDGIKLHIKPFLNEDEISGLDSAPDLPNLSPGALFKLHEKIMLEFGYARQIIEEYWTSDIQLRPEGERNINCKDAFILFEKCISTFKNESTAKIPKVLFEENSTATSWSSEKNAVVIAGKRKPFKDVDEFFGVFVHEFGVHGRRWMNGSEVSLPEISKGVYTINDGGELVDYLTFEEGLASTMQNAAANKIEEWGMDSLGLYLVAGLADEGRSDREIYELLLRIRVLSSLKDGGIVITEKKWSTASKNTLTHLVRLFRGIPMSKDGFKQVVYLKDMAYLNGKIRVINYLNSLSMDIESWDQNYANLFKAKIDNSEPSQQALLPIQ